LNPVEELKNLIDYVNNNTQAKIRIVDENLALTLKDTYNGDVIGGIIYATIHHKKLVLLHYNEKLVGMDNVRSLALALTSFIHVLETRELIASHVLCEDMGIILQTISFKYLDIYTATKHPHLHSLIEPLLKLSLRILNIPRGINEKADKILGILDRIVEKIEKEKPMKPSQMIDLIRRDLESIARIYGTTISITRLETGIDIPETVLLIEQKIPQHYTQ